MKCSYVIVLEVDTNQEPDPDEIWCAIKEQPWKQRTEVVSVKAPDARLRALVEDMKRWSLPDHRWPDCACQSCRYVHAHARELAALLAPAGAPPQEKKE